jgi:TatD DNase family protein
MTNFIDIHTHRFKKDENTFSIYNILLPCDEIPEKTKISVGVHPWHIEQIDLFQIENMLAGFASKDNVLTIGECGFDRSIKIPIEKQTEVFRIHLAIAKKYEKPLIIHCVRAYSDLVEILKKEKFRGKLVLHNFVGNKFQIDQFLKFETYFSTGKQLVFPDSKFFESLKYIPIERLFFETDDSDFTIKDMYMSASVLLQIPLEVLKSQIQHNLTQLFGKELNGQNII